VDGVEEIRKRHADWISAGGRVNIPGHPAMVYAHQWDGWLAYEPCEVTRRWRAGEIAEKDRSWEELEVPVHGSVWAVVSEICTQNDLGVVVCWICDRTLFSVHDSCQPRPRHLEISSPLLWWATGRQS